MAAQKLSWPIQQLFFISMTPSYVFKDGLDMVRHLAIAEMAPQLVSWKTIVRLFEVNKCSIQL